MWTRRAILLAGSSVALPLLAAPPETRLRVEVTNHKGDPVDRASVIVRFVEGRSVKRLGRKKNRRWELKTNQQGIARMPPLPQGKIMVQVIADKYQTHGELVEVYEEEKTIQVELNPPQPQYSAH
jgi:hypothetical protein